MTVIIRKAGLIMAGLLILLIRGRLNAENADIKKSVNLSNFTASIEEPVRRDPMMYHYKFRNAVQVSVKM